MSSASEAAGAIDALRQRAGELAGKVNSSKGQAEAMVGALEGIGAEDKSVQVKAVEGKLEAAEASRAGFEGTLAKAHFMMLSVMHGTMGPAAAGATSSMINNADGTVSWHGTVDGIKTKIVYDDQPQNAPGATGSGLVQEVPAQTRLEPDTETPARTRFGRAAQTMVKEEASAPAKAIGDVLDNFRTALRDDKGATSASSATETTWIAEVHRPSIQESRANTPTFSVGSTFEAVAVASIVLMKAGQTLASTMSGMRKAVKERGADDKV